MHPVCHVKQNVSFASSKGNFSTFSLKRFPPQACRIMDAKENSISTGALANR